MCEQAARYCRAGVQKLLRKPAPALRGLDGLLRWAAGRMGDKGLAERELLSPGAAAAQRKGTSVILDVSAPCIPHPGSCLPPPASRTAAGAGMFLWSCAPCTGRHGLDPGSCSPQLGGCGCPASSCPCPAPTQAPRYPPVFPRSSISRTSWARGCSPASLLPWILRARGAPRILHPASSLASGLFLGFWGWHAAQVLHLPGWLGVGVPRISNPFPYPVPLGYLGQGVAARVWHPLVQVLHLLDCQGSLGPMSPCPALSGTAGNKLHLDSASSGPGWA